MAETFLAEELKEIAKTAEASYDGSRSPAECSACAYAGAVTMPKKAGAKALAHMP